LHLNVVGFYHCKIPVRIQCHTVPRRFPLCETDKEIKLVPASNSSKATQVARESILTQGEWEFLNISVSLQNENCAGQTYDRIKYTVLTHPKMKICWTFTDPQAIQDVDEFVSFPEKIWRNWILHYLLTSGSSAVNGCRH